MKTIAGLLLTGIGLESVSGGLLNPLISVKSITKTVDQGISKLISVSDQRAKDRRRLPWGDWHDDCDHHHHHHHHDDHEDHAWWTNAQRGGPHAESNPEWKYIGDTKYCRDIEGLKENKVNGGWEIDGSMGCDCPLGGIMSLLVRNEGKSDLVLHTLEVSLRDGGRQLGWDEEEGLDFVAGEELQIGINKNWLWDGADTLILNGNYEDDVDTKHNSTIAFHLEPIEICVSHIKNKNPVGWGMLAPVHITHSYTGDQTSDHTDDDYQGGKDIRVGVVAMFRHDGNPFGPDKGAKVCSDGWTQCDKMPKKDDSQSNNGGHWHWYDAHDSHGYGHGYGHEDHFGHSWHH